jgi:hypothetical protein
MHTSTTLIDAVVSPDEGRRFLGAISEHGSLCMRLISALVGLLFVIAAILKATMLGDPAGSIAPQPLAFQPKLGEAIIAFEFGLGFWLISGVQPYASHIVALACLASFGGMSFAKFLAGETSCGCFGRVELNPGITFLIDVAGVVALLGARNAWRRKMCGTGRGERWQ